MDTPRTRTLSERFTVVLLGPDGCGKSTLALSLVNKLENSGYNVKHRHWRPERLPSPRVFMGQKPTGDTSRPHAKLDHSKLEAILLAVYYWLDFWIDFISELCGYDNNIIVAERYIYDMAIDPRRHRLSKIRWLTKMLAMAFPRPDLLVLLVGSPAILHERKPELSPVEIGRQLKDIGEYFSSFQNTLVIDTTVLSSSESVERILAVLKNKMRVSCYVTK